MHHFMLVKIHIFDREYIDILFEKLFLMVIYYIRRTVTFESFFSVNLFLFMINNGIK